MADVVQYKLERMVNELDDLEKRGLFTRQEIAEIVKQRRKFEYRLKRPSPLKQDYLAYIEYEKQIDSLRLLRKKALARERREKGNKKMKKGVSDFAGVSRILDVYRLALTRFKGDVELWFQYLEFCKERRNGRMKKVLAKLFRFHPKVPGVWIYGAAWEFDHNLNVVAARALMQKGLRVCPKSEDLWVEYLRMELTFLNKLKARSVALGEDDGSLAVKQVDAGEKQWREDNQDLFMSIEDGEGKGEGRDEENERSKKPDYFQGRALGILQAVYGGAVMAIPSSIGLRQRLFEIVEATDLAQSEDLKRQILDDMKRDFSTVPEYWEWLAKIEYHVSERSPSGSNVSQLQRAIKVYEEAIKYVPTALMFKSYINFLMAEVSAEKGEQKDSNVSSLSENDISLILNVYEKAQTAGCLDEDLACQYVSLHLQLGRIQEARNLAKKLCSGSLASAVKLWTLRASIEMKCAEEKSCPPSKDDLSSVFQLLKNVLRRVESSAAESLWLLAIKFFAYSKSHFDKLLEVSLYSLAKGSVNDNEFSLSSTIVNFILQKDGLQRAREMYKRFLALPRPDLALFRTCIELESRLASVGNQDCVTTLRKLFESALAMYEPDLSLWRDYYAIELKMGTPETASAVLWRARKTLGDEAGFITSSDL
uniref:U3 small nucleolar RNA-associated protein 6 n=1 Tax=Kalanchoe fedtschenkoi TaxID=63787 RepID=A0A7N0TN89_KALFE